jgi:hypothetical protein
VSSTVPVVDELRSTSPALRIVCEVYKSSGFPSDSDLGRYTVSLDCRHDAGFKEEDVSLGVTTCGSEGSAGPSPSTDVVVCPVVPTVPYLHVAGESMCVIPVLGVPPTVPRDVAATTFSHATRVADQLCQDTAADDTRPCTMRTMSSGRPPDIGLITHHRHEGHAGCVVTVLFVLN